MGIWILTIWILETYEYQTFWSSDFKWYSIQLVGLCAMSYVLDRPFKYLDGIRTHRGKASLQLELGSEHSTTKPTAFIQP